MKNLWPESFEENDKPSAKSILEEQGKLLAKITTGIVFGEVVEIDEIEQMQSNMRNDFGFRFDLRGKFLEGYKFKVLTFSHDITLYPVKLDIDGLIAKEVGVERTPVGGYKKSVDDPGELEQILSTILSSERIRNVVGSIMKLSR